MKSIHLRTCVPFVTLSMSKSVVFNSVSKNLAKTYAVQRHARFIDVCISIQAA